MTVSFIRILFVLISAVIGLQLGPTWLGGRPEAGIFGSAIGALMAGGVIWMEASLARVSLRGLSAAVFGLLLALMVSKFVTDAVDVFGMSPMFASSLKLVLVLLLSYLGMVLAMRGRDEFNLIIPYVKLQRQNQTDSVVLLDTSAIIDGRITDLVKTHFVEGHYIVPRFVLKELQRLADSSDEIKRSKGRRGLEILSRLRKDARITLRIHDEDFADLTDVDSKLVKLAKLLEARILTNDYNLNKVAELQDVTILNLHELSLALRPIVFPGDTLEVSLVKEGKEKEQAVAYLGDGTMVVVEHAKALIGTTLKVDVASVLQTAAGRMIFARLKHEPR